MVVRAQPNSFVSDSGEVGSTPTENSPLNGTTRRVPRHIRVARVTPICASACDAWSTLRPVAILATCVRPSCVGHETVAGARRARFSVWLFFAGRRPRRMRSPASTSPSSSTRTALLRSKSASTTRHSAVCPRRMSSGSGRSKATQSRDRHSIAPFMNRSPPQSPGRVFTIAFSIWCSRRESLCGSRGPWASTERRQASIPS